MAKIPEISKLSNARLQPGQHWCDIFLDRGLADFHSVCHWLWKLPYGSNSEKHLDALIKDGCGTCTTKHGIAAALASELNLPIHKYIVYYKLDTSVRPGVDHVLKKHGLPFIPASHCVLIEDTHLVDLTWGNNTGKLKDLTEFEIYARVPPLPSEAAMHTLDAWAYQGYAAKHEAFIKKDATTLSEIRRECIQYSKIQCAC